MSSSDEALHSPNEILAAARQGMLDGRYPESVEDWEMLLMGMAVLVDPDVALPAVQLFVLMYEIPVSEERAAELVKAALLVKAEQITI